MTKKTLKKLIAFLCMITIFVTSLTIIPEVQASSSSFAGYEPVTLDDFGISEGTYTNNADIENFSFRKQISRGRTTLNKTVLSLYATFELNTSLYYGIGGVSDWTSVTLKLADAKTLYLICDDWNQAVTFSASEFGLDTLVGVEVKIKLATEIVDSDLKVVASVNDCPAKTLLKTGAASSLNTYLAAIGTIRVRPCTDEDLFAEYTPITLMDFGLQDQNYNVLSWDYAFHNHLLDGSSLDNKNLIMNVTFHDAYGLLILGDTDDAVVGEGIGIKPSKANADDTTVSKVVIYSCSALSYELAFDLETMNIDSLIGTPLKISIGLEYLDNDGEGQENDLKVIASVNDCEAKTAYFNNHNSLGNGLASRIYGKLDISNYYEKSPAGLKRIGWEDFGITDEKQYTSVDTPENGVVANPASEGVKSLIGTSFRGDLALTKAEASGYFITYADCGLNSLGIRITPQVDGTILVQGMDMVVGWPYLTIATLTPEKLGRTSLVDGSEFELGIDIWEVEDNIDSIKDLKINIFVDGVSYTIKTFVWENAIQNNASASTPFWATNLNFFNIKHEGDCVEIKLPEKSPEQLTQIDWYDFGFVKDQEYTMADTPSNGVISHTLNSGVSSLIGTSFRGTMALTKASDSSYFISYADNGLNGLGIRITPQVDGTLLVQGMDTVVGWPYVTIATIDPEKVCLASFVDGTEFELGIDIWEVDDAEDSVKDIKINLFINGIQYTKEAVVWENAIQNNTTAGTMFWGKNFNFVSVKKESDMIKVVVPEKEQSPEGLKKIAWSDFNITDANNSFTQSNEDAADGTHIRALAGETSVLGTSFRGIINLTRSSEPASTDYFYLCYGSKGWNWSGIRMNLSDGKLKVVAVGINDDGTATSKDFGLLDPEIAGIASFTDVPFEFGIDIWEEETDIKFNIFFNGEQYNFDTYIWEDASGKGYIADRINFIVHGANDAMVAELPEKVGCDIQENPAGYLLAGTQIRVDGVKVTNGTTLTEMGDYQVLYVSENGAYAEEVSCYTPGDAHPDSKINICDLVAVKKASEGTELATGVATWAADVNKSSSVDDNDLDLIRNMLLTTTTVVSTIASYSLTEDASVMPIGGFYGPYDSLINDQAFDLIKASGINFMTFLPYVYGINDTDNSQIMKTLKLAEERELSVFVTDERVRGSRIGLSAEELAGIIKDYSQYRSFAGLSIIDEPSIEYYGDTDALESKNISYFSQVSSSINAYENVSAYSNLFPLNELLHIDDTQEYETLYKNYLNDYCTTYNPKYISYDHYPFEWSTNAITGNNLTQENGITDASRYFKNLAIVRNVAEENEIPFWTYIGSGDYFGYKKETNNDGPTEGQFKWQVNVELAFGAKGIQYFPLIQPQGWEETEGGEADYKRNGLIGANGEATDWYYYAKDMNEQIQAVDHILMNSVNEGVMVTSYGYASSNMAAAAEYDMPIITAYNDVVNSINSTGTKYGAIAGCFDYQGKTAVYVVNYDVTSTQTITLDLDGEHAFTTINRYGSNTGTAKDELALSIERGEAVLVVFD